MPARYYYAISLLGGIVFVVVGAGTGSNWLIFCGCVGPLIAITFGAIGRKRILRPLPLESSAYQGHA